MLGVLDHGVDHVLDDCFADLGHYHFLDQLFLLCFLLEVVLHLEVHLPGVSPFHKAHISLILSTRILAQLFELRHRVEVLQVVVKFIDLIIQFLLFDLSFSPLVPLRWWVVEMLLDEALRILILLIDKRVAGRRAASAEELIETQRRHLREKFINFGEQVVEIVGRHASEHVLALLLPVEQP